MSRLAPTFQQVRSKFRWDSASQRYRLASSGKFVKASAVKAAVNRVITGAKSEIASLARQVADGSIEIGEWQVRMAAHLKALHLSAVAAARGSFPNMTAADYGRAGQVLRTQYGYLNQFAVDIETGRTLPGRIESRAALYAAAANSTHEAARQAGAVEAGFVFERNLLHPGESCLQCIEQTERGWVAIGELIPIGSRTCRANCNCSLSFARE